MKIRKKTLALLLFSVAFMCSVGVSAFVLWQTDALRLQSEPVVSPSVQTEILYAARAEDGRWGYIDGQGEWQIAAQFEQARAFDGKVAWVRQNGLWGAVDATGEFAVQPEYKRIEQYVDGNNRFMAAFDSVASSQATNSSLYDINGQKLFGLAGELLPPSSGLMAFSREKGGKITWGYINPHGEIIIEPDYAKVGQAAGNYALVKDENGRTMLLNIYAKTGIEFAAAVDLNAVGSRLVLVRDEVSGLYGFMDVDGNLQIDYSLAAAEAFRGGAAVAAEAANGDAYARYGLLTSEGVWAVEPAYRGGVYLDNGIYAMALMDEPGYHIVNALGENIIDGVVYRYEDWANGLMACHTADKTLFVNTQGKQEADLTLALTPNVVWQGRLYGVMDENGASWFDGDGRVVFAEGRERQLTENVRLVTVLENTFGGYLAYYPQVEGEKLSAQWNKLNTVLKNAAVDDYFADCIDGEDINFTANGDFVLTEQGNVMTVCQRLTLEDSQQSDGVENVLNTVCFDKTNGRQYRLGDLFADNFNWRTELSELLTINYQLQSAGRGEVTLVEVIELLEKRLARNVDFSCGADGVTLYFALSDGHNVGIDLLYADVDEWLDKDGALWQALGMAAQPTE